MSARITLGLLIAIASFSNYSCANMANYVDTAIYYVDAMEGLDINDGLSAKTPWQTIKKINATNFNPGDKILLKRGNTWRESLVIPSSGSSGLPIVFDAFGVGANPVINGSKRVTSWNKTGFSYVKKSITMPAFIYYNNIRLTRNKGAKQNVGLNQWDWNNNSLWVNVSDNPDNGMLEVNSRNLCVYASGKNYISMQNITLEKAQQQFMQVSNGRDWTLRNIVAKNGIDPDFPGASGRGLFFINDTYVNISDIELYESYGDSGISVNGSDNIVITKSKIHDHRGDGIYVANSTNITLEENLIYGQTDWFSDNIQFNKTNNYKILRNNVSLQGSNSNKGNIIVTEGSNGIIQGNQAAFGAYGVSCSDSNTIVEFNTVHDHTSLSWHSGLYMASGLASHDITWRHNISYRDNYGILADTYQNDAHTNIKIYNNTVLESKLSNVSVNNITGIFKNNIIWSSNVSKAVYAVGSIASGGEWISDNNDIGPEASGFIYYKGNNYNTLTSYSYTEGKDTNSIPVFPMFTDLQRFDFSLQAGSPLINAGSIIESDPNPASNLNIGAY